MDSPPQPDAGDLLRIGELAALTEKTIRALHLYEERGLLEPVQRSKGGFRLYDRHNLARIRYIDRLQALGLSLNDIAALVRDWRDGHSAADAMTGLAAAYRARLAEVRGSIERLQALERELESALGFIDEGCVGCAVPERPRAACGGCSRTEARADLPLIAGLAGR